ncbi:MAG: DUF1559 domain-containing protein [Planctomycetales bacterium]|nr:DUF1559 domain-containing protein [Planctomycetales bacterium]MCA9167502.1 DUF1559 domain-containing protein [Planctomycetales bacterium]
MLQRTRRAFSLVELLVVIAVISIMILLLLPAINAAREAGRRTHCINNQRNVVDAIINYETAHRALPSAVALCDANVWNSLGRETGVDCMGPNWASQILGFIDEQQRYSALAYCMHSQWHAADDCPEMDGELGRVTPSFMICPSAPGIPKVHTSAATGFDRLSKGHYAACLGSQHYRTAIVGSRDVQHNRDDKLKIGAMNAVLIENFEELREKERKGLIAGEWKLGNQIGTKLNKIPSSSKTILISEVRTWDGPAADSVDIRGVWTSASMGASTYTHKYGPNSTQPDAINGCDKSIPRGSPLFCEQVVTSGPDSAETWASARSAHPGGVVASRLDGSVGFFSDDIHLPLWQSFGTRVDDTP